VALSPALLIPRRTARPARTTITGALFVAADSNHLETADNAALDLGTGDFVINVNVRRATTGNQVIMSKYQDANNYWKLEFNSSHYVHFYAIAGGTHAIDLIASTTACSSTSTAYHIQLAVDRSSADNCRLFVNGVSQSFSVSPYSTDEKVTNGTFTDNITGWTNNDPWWPWETCEYSSGKLHLQQSGDGDPSQGIVASPVSLTTGATYLLTYTLTKTSGTNINLTIGNAVADASSYSVTKTASGTYSTTFTKTNANSTHIVFWSANNKAENWLIDDVSIKAGSLVTATDISNTGKLYVGALGDGSLYFNGRVSMLGIGKPTTADGLHVYTIGNSITVLWGAYLATPTGAYWTLHNVGVNGNTTTQMQARFAFDVTDAGICDTVVIMGGVNDVINGVAAGDIETNLQAMYTAAHNAGAKVIACTITPFKGHASWTSGKQTVLDTVNTWIANTATNVDVVVDTYTLMEDPATADTYLPAYDSGDYLHPGTDGSDAISDAVYAATTWHSDLETIKGASNIGQYYAEQSSADKTSLAWTAFWDFKEASGNRTDSVASIVLSEVGGTIDDVTE